jgi:nucleoside-diphosphate-sugar epimerase
MSTYLVTGGGGFIGSHIAATLVARGQRVRVLDNFITGRRENLAPLMDGIELIEGDVADEQTARRAVEGVEAVFHQAALPSVPRSIADPLAAHRSNTFGTLQILLAARDAGVRRVVFASSSAIYGDSPTMPKRENMPPAPKSPYAATKLAGEAYCQSFTDAYGLETVSLRYFNVFGPRQDPLSEYAAVIPKFITALLAGRSPTIYGDGEQSRDFTYISNVVEANLLAAEAPAASGRVFNIACGKRISLLELVAVLNDICGTNLTPEHTAPRPGDVRHSLADISPAQAVLGYEVTTSLEEGLRQTVEWYREGHV